MWTEQAVQEVLLQLRNVLGALGNIGDQLERIANVSEGKPPSSRLPSGKARGGK